MKNNVLYVHECEDAYLHFLRRRLRERFPIRWSGCANGLYDNYINYLHTERRVEAESFTFVSND